MPYELTDAPAQPDDLNPALAGREVVGGHYYMRDASGRLVPLELVKPADKLIDQTVRTCIDFAQELSDQIARFKAHTFDDVNALLALLADEYGAAPGGAKGNVTLTSFDGTLKVQVQRQDHIAFGPELNVAKSLVDECIAGWASDARAEIRALVEHAFQVDKQGRINRAALYQLRRVNIEDETWARAMQALTDSMRSTGTATYVRFYRRESPERAWTPITIDLAAARAPAKPEAAGGGS